MSKGGGSQTVTQKLDPAAMAQRAKLYNKANTVAATPWSGFGGPGVAGANPMSLEALKALGPGGALARGYGQAAGGLGIGMNALQQGLGMNFAGADLSGYMNPYQSQVMDQWNKQFGDLRQSTLNDVNAQAQQAGAFGGSRHGVAAGQALGDLGKAQALQQAGLLQSGFSDAAQRWAADRANMIGVGGQLANLGFGGLQGQQGLADARLQGGDYLRQLQQQQLDYNRGQFTEQRDWDQRQLQALLAAMGAPTGSATTQPWNSNPMAGAAGGAITALGAGLGPIGVGAGAGIGLLGSLF